MLAMEANRATAASAVQENLKMAAKVGVWEEMVALAQEITPQAAQPAPA
jgi:hypothetical protein